MIKLTMMEFKPKKEGMNMDQEMKESLYRFYFELKNLLSYSKWYESNLDSIREEYNFLFECTELSDNTKSKFNYTLDFLKDYYNKVPFSKIPVFKFFDPTFINFLDEVIIPLLSSLKLDLKKLDILISDKEKLKIEKPKDGVIIREIENLYKKR